MTEQSIDDWVADLVTANRILAREHVLDSFGHISIRHPYAPEHYLIARAVSPAVVTAMDVVELDMTGEPVRPCEFRLYAERAIHSAIYRARADIMAICHNHAPSVLPFASSGVPIVPVVQLGAVIGAEVPMWDSRDAFGDTSLLVTTAAEGESLARTLGPHWAVIMRRHGATVGGRSLRETVFRSIALSQNAEVQMKAAMLGPISTLTPLEIDRAGSQNLSAHVLDRAWTNWSQNL